MKLIIKIAASVIIVITVICLSFLFKDDDMIKVNEKNILGNTNTNLYAGGYIAEQDGYLFIRKSVNQLLILSTENGYSKNIKVNEPDQIQVLGEYIYYTSDIALVRATPLYRMRLNGHDKRQITDDYIKMYLIYKDYIYYTHYDTEGLFRCDLNGKNKISIYNGEVNSFAVDGEKVYFASNDSVLCTDLDGDNLYELFSFKGIWKLSVYENKIFFRTEEFFESDDEKSYYIIAFYDLQNKNIIEVVNKKDITHNYSFYKDTLIYYTYNSGYLKVNLNNLKESPLNLNFDISQNIIYDSIYIFEDKIYYLAVNEEHDISVWEIDIDGNLINVH